MLQRLKGEPLTQFITNVLELFESKADETMGLVQTPSSL